MFSQQRKLLLLVFLWTCLCLLVYKSSTKTSLSKHQKRALTTTTSTSAAASSQQQQPRPQQPGRQIDPSAATAAAGESLSAQASGRQPKKSSVPSSRTQQQPPTTAATTTTAKPPEQCHYNYPNLLDLQFNNIHWQSAQIVAPPGSRNATSASSASSSSAAAPTQAAATFYLYNAYYDDRWRGGAPSVRVLAMIDRIQPPPTDCLLWSRRLAGGGRDGKQLVPLVSRASFVYAWYPKWGNYKDGLLQPWIVTCQVPRGHQGLVPDSVSLVPVPPFKTPEASETSEASEVDENDDDNNAEKRLKITVPSVSKREVSSQDTQQLQASIAMPASFSSSVSPSVSSTPSRQPQAANRNGASNTKRYSQASQKQQQQQYDCSHLKPITNNLPVMNKRPQTKGKFAVCVKGLDFPHEDVSIRLVEWIELLNLLGAGKIFLYELDVHENISKVLHYYQERGMVELSPLTLPGDQPNLPEYQHLYLKSKLTTKRQNELIPYNDCLYRNLYSYQYLALLDIDEIIMPLEHHNWLGLMEQVERISLAEQNYSRASYNVRNVYFFDDLAGPLGTTSSTSSSQQAEFDDEPNSSSQNEVDDSQTRGGGGGGDSLERGIPHYLHMMQHVYRSKNYTQPGQYVKCFHNTERVVSLHNHFPMNCFGQCTTYSVPVKLAHLQHYRKDCVGPLKQSCKNDFRMFTTRDTTIWKYKQQMIRRTTRVLNHLGLLDHQKRRRHTSDDNR